MDSKLERTVKGKAGKYCPFFETWEDETGKKRNKPCGTNCALFCIGLNSCVFHAINLNLQGIVKKLPSEIEDDPEGNRHGAMNE